MTNFKTRMATAIATGSVLLQALAPVTFATTDITISGNGAGSDNNVNVTQNTTTSVNQTNNANVSNYVNADADTGNNSASFNTGGNVTVGSGNAMVNATVSNNLNKNIADVDCCQAGNTTVNVSGNGAFSNNTANLTQNSTTNLKQNNYANVTNNVNVDADTGDNDAKFNTGDGDVTVISGHASVNATVNTTANTNWAHIGPATGNGTSDVSLMILDNGAGSENKILANLTKNTNLTQNNTAYIDNYVDADADTGDNDAKFNTGDGDVIILSGDASVDAAIDNAVNFNFADVDCGCTFGLTAEISGNGAEPGLSSDDDNTIRARLNSSQVYAQGNLANLYNDYDGWTTDTGDNDASFNTGDGTSAVVSGDGHVDVGISNSGNQNVIGSLPGLPELPEVDFGVDWGAFIAFFGMFVNS